MTDIFILYFSKLEQMIKCYASEYENDNLGILYRHDSTQNLHVETWYLVNKIIANPLINSPLK